MSKTSKIIKTFFALLIFALFVFTFNSRVKATSNTLISDFKYYPVYSVDTTTRLRVMWKSSKEMLSLTIKLLDTTNNTTYKIFDLEEYLDKIVNEGKSQYSNDLDDIEPFDELEDDKEYNYNEYDLVYKNYYIPFDDPDTDTNEALGKYYSYYIDFKVDTTKYGMISLVYDYTCEDEETSEINSYSNQYHLYMIKTSLDVEDPKKSKSLTTRLAIVTSLFSTIAGVGGTFLIILSTKNNKFIDKEEDEA